MPASAIVGGTFIHICTANVSIPSESRWTRTTCSIARNIGTSSQWITASVSRRTFIDRWTGSVLGSWYRAITNRARRIQEDGRGIDHGTWRRHVHKPCGIGARRTSNIRAVCSHIYKCRGIGARWTSDIRTGRRHIHKPRRICAGRTSDIHAGCRHIDKHGRIDGRRTGHVELWTGRIEKDGRVQGRRTGDVGTDCLIQSGTGGIQKDCMVDKNGGVEAHWTYGFIFAMDTRECR